MPRKSKETMIIESEPTNAVDTAPTAKACCGAFKEELIHTPPKSFHRNRFGLLEDSSIKYVYNEQGLIDWRAMIPKEFLVVNKQAFKNKPVPDSIDGLKDNELLTLLGGSKYLASLRGYESVRYTVNSPSENYVVATCTINWVRNYETENREVSFSAIGDAHPRNTTSFASNYLAAIAENRAFVRAVRNFLRIQVLSQEEIGGTIIESSAIEDPSTKILNDLLVKHSIPFDKLRTQLIKENVADAEKFNSIQDIPRFQIYTLIGRIKDKYEKKTEITA